MKQEMLWQYCPHYNGEETDPYEEKERNRKRNAPYQDPNYKMLWFYERCWCMEMADADSVDAIPHSLAEYTSDYIRAGLETFCQNDEIPLTLKALLFNRYAKCSGGLSDAIEEFRRFYRIYYQSALYWFKSRSELIERCHYYKGENEPPSGVDELFWDYERRWVDAVEREYIKNERGIKEVASWLRQYYEAGLKGFRFNPSLIKDNHDDCPESLRALLWCRYCHWAAEPNAREFKRHYKEGYLSYLNLNKRKGKRD